MISPSSRDGRNQVESVDAVFHDESGVAGDIGARSSSPRREPEASLRPLRHAGAALMHHALPRTEQEALERVLAAFRGDSGAFPRDEHGI
jgi:hypothetical protein